MPLSWDLTVRWFASFDSLDQRQPEQRRNRRMPSRLGSSHVARHGNQLAGRRVAYWFLWVMTTTRSALGGGGFKKLFQPPSLVLLERGSGALREPPWRRD